MRIRGFWRLDNQRRGMIAVQVALSLTALLSVAALAVDVGILLAEQRHAQAAADAAALAGAIDLYTNYPTNNGTDPNSTALKSAEDTAATNGYTNDGTTNTVTVNIPPQSGLFVGVAGYVEVIVQYNEPRFFSNVFGSGAIPVKARAVARGAWVTPKGGGDWQLENVPGSFTDSGGGNFNLNGGTANIYSLYTGTTGAMTVNGGGSVTAAGYSVSGTITASNNSTVVGTQSQYQPPGIDPLWWLPVPAMPAAGTITKTALGSGSGFLYTLTPGAFGGGSGQPKLPNFTQSDQVVFGQDPSGNGALYYLTAGGLTSNGANLTMGSGSGGILFYNAGTGTNDSISIAGSASGTVNLYGINSTVTTSPMYTYYGLLIFQARNATENVSITGNGNFTMEGGFYAANATLKLAGQGTSSIIGSMLDSGQLSVSGQGNITMDYGGFPQPKGRFLGLVE